MTCIPFPSKLPILLLGLGMLLGTQGAHAEMMPGFQRGPWFGEQVREEHLPDGVRLYYNAPGSFDPARRTLVLFYATPNGNSIDQTWGCRAITGSDWHFDIQHVGAQVRRLRELEPGENLVAVLVEADGKSWPVWRGKHVDNAAQIRALVEAAVSRIPGSEKRVALTGHSGGGSFIFGFINASAEIPAYVARIAFLDANYGYAERDLHGDKLLKWLREDTARRLDVIAYDDREIQLDGKKVVGPAGGTYRATMRMLERLRKHVAVSSDQSPTLATYAALGGRFTARVALNPENKILHTALVGKWNGLLEVLAPGKPWGTFGGPRAYTAWVQPGPQLVPGIPVRATHMLGGPAAMRKAADLPLAERESFIAAEIAHGNLPDFLKTLKKIELAEGPHRATIQVMPDYLSVGSDADWVRVPLTPMTAQALADAFGFSLTTRKLCDEICRQAEMKLAPQPLTEERESVRTFIEHHDLIEKQRGEKPLGVLVAGIKKDVVITNRLSEQPHRVAIYGWHQPDGKPIQPLTIVHQDTYVDYSHGIRLVRQEMTVDGKPMRLEDVLRDPKLAPLVSDEGIILVQRY